MKRWLNIIFVFNCIILHIFDSAVLINDWMQNSLTSLITENITRRQTTLIQCTSANLQVILREVSINRWMEEATILNTEWKSSMKSMEILRSDREYYRRKAKKTLPPQYLLDWVSKESPSFCRETEDCLWWSCRWDSSFSSLEENNIGIRKR